MFVRTLNIGQLKLLDLEIVISSHLKDTSQYIYKWLYFLLLTPNSMKSYMYVCIYVCNTQSVHQVNFATDHSSLQQ